MALRTFADPYIRPARSDRATACRHLERAPILLTVARPNMEWRGPGEGRWMTDASIARESARRSLLITGATGFIGARLATAALERGYDVRTLTRGDWSSAPWISTSQRYFGSLPSQIPHSLCDGIDVVVHCAADVAG